METQICTQCHQEKPIDQFYRRGGDREGYRGKCKECTSKVLRRYEQSPAGKATKRRYRVSEKGKEAQRRYYKTEKGKRPRKRREKRQTEKHPARRKAKQAVNDAVRSEKLPRVTDLVCSICKEPAQEYHHYRGYAKRNWLNVQPLCRTCHVNAHNHQS